MTRRLINALGLAVGVVATGCDDTAMISQQTAEYAQQQGLGDLDATVKEYRSCTLERAIGAAKSTNPNAVLNATARCDYLLATYQKQLIGHGVEAEKAQTYAAQLQVSTRKAVGGVLIAAALNAKA
jgi:hypothetical protein